MAYREGGSVDPDLDARESDAIAAFGRWSERTRTIVLAVSVAVGIALGVVAAFIVVGVWRASLHVPDDYEVFPPRWLEVGPIVVMFVGSMFAGRAVSRVVVRRATPAKLAELAARFAVPAERLRETTDLANRL